MMARGISQRRKNTLKPFLDEFDMGGVAGAVGLSRYHFARLFKKHVGTTPYGYY